MKDSIWPASVAALMMHSLVISALAFGVGHSEGGMPWTLKNRFYAQVVFEQGTQEEPKSTPVPINPITQKKPSKKPTQKRGQQENQDSLLVSIPTSPSPLLGVAPVFNPPPIYPLEARRKKIQGVVLVRLFLTQTGEVDKATPLSPRIDPILEEAALRAIRQWRFNPGVKTLEIPIEFKLDV